MTENQEGLLPRRRTSEEVKALTLEYEGSGLRRSEFCRKHHLALSTLQRQLRRLNPGKAHSPRLVAVEMADKDRDGINPKSIGLEVVLAGGRRIEVRRDFDGETLLRLVAVLEGN